MQYAISYAKERKTFGLPIAQHQGVSFMLADMYWDIMAARVLTQRAIMLIDSGYDNLRASIEAKVFADEMVMRVTTDAVQIFGGYGYSREYPVEKLMRDSKVSQLIADSNENLCFMLGDELIDSVK